MGNRATFLHCDHFVHFTQFIHGIPVFLHSDFPEEVTNDSSGSSRTSPSFDIVLTDIEGLVYLDLDLDRAFDTFDGFADGRLLRIQKRQHRCTTATTTTIEIIGTPNATK